MTWTLLIAVALSAALLTELVTLIVVIRLERRALESRWIRHLDLLNAHLNETERRLDV